MGDPNQYTDLDMGPLIDANALKSVEEKVKKAVSYTHLRWKWWMTMENDAR